MENRFYIIEYTAGTKGDFLSNFIVNKSINLTDFNRSIFKEVVLKHFLYHASKDDHVDENELRNILKNVKQVTNAHDLTIIEQKGLFHLIGEYGGSVKKILYDRRYYSTVTIESLIKNQKNKVDGFEYTVDRELVEKNLALTTENRAMIFEDVLLRAKDNRYVDYYDFFNGNGNSGKDLWNYEDLFVNIDLNDPLFNGIDKDSYKEAVSKTWLPRHVEMFDRTWDLYQYGYLQF